jgi:hypothetical protein
MRTTLTLDDQLFRQLKLLAAETNSPFKDVVDRALRAGVESLRQGERARPVRIKTYRMGHPVGLDLTKAHAIAASLEDEEIVRKLQLRK